MRLACNFFEARNRACVLIGCAHPMSKACAQGVLPLARKTYMAIRFVHYKDTDKQWSVMAVTMHPFSTCLCLPGWMNAKPCHVSIGTGRRPMSEAVKFLIPFSFVAFCNLPSRPEIKQLIRGKLSRMISSLTNLPFKFRSFLCICERAATTKMMSRSLDNRKWFSCIEQKELRCHCYVNIMTVLET